MSVKSNQLEVPFTLADKNKLDGVATGAQANPAIATEAEAEAGTDNVKMMTALRVKQAILALGGGGGGEANTASNLGAGAGIYKQKVGVDLQLKSLVAGSGVTLTPATDTIIISANAGGLSNTDSLPEGSTNLYFTNSRVAAAPAVALNTAKVSADGSINTHSDVTITSPTTNQVLAWNGSQWVNTTISTGGEANTASNLGTGTGLFKQKSSVDLQFKTLKAGTNVSITSDANEVTINASGGGGSGMDTQYLSFDGGNVRILASGLTADLADVDISKDFSVSAVSRLLLTVPAGVIIHSVAATFTSGETSGRTEVRLELPEPNGASTLATSIRPIGYRLNASSGLGATGGTITLVGSNIVLALTGYTQGAEQRLVAQF